MLCCVFFCHDSVHNITVDKLFLVRVCLLCFILFVRYLLLKMVCNITHAVIQLILLSLFITVCDFSTLYLFP